MVWARTKVEGTATTVNEFIHADALTDLKSRLGADLPGLTVIRVRGQVIIGTDLTTRVPASGVMAARIFTESQLNTIEDADGPVQDRYADWFMYQPFTFLSDESDGRFVRLDVDVRAARKLDEVGQGILFGIQKDDEAGLIQINGFLSWLLKLP